MMMFKHTAVIVAVMTASVAGCATHTTTQTTWTTPQGGGAQRYGTVVEVRETIQRRQGNPAGGAAVGAVVGGSLGRTRAGTVAGAAGGAAIGAGMSQGSSQNVRYDVRVQFEDGSTRTFVYGGGTLFRPGDTVVTTPNGGLARA